MILKPVIYLILLLLMSQLTRAQQDTRTKKKPPEKASTAKTKKTNTPNGGKVLDRRNEEPVADALVKNLSTGISKATNSDGWVMFEDLKPYTYLKVSGKNIITDTYYLGRQRGFVIYVEKKLSSNVATVAIHTGYQYFKKNSNTSANFSVKQAPFQQRVAINVPQRLEGLVPALLVTNNNPATNKPAGLTIGARTSLVNPYALIVIDDFPLEGNLININPDDVEDISVLRDATAIGIWGARAANGVVVIKTRSAKYIDRFRVSFNTSVGTAARPDPFQGERMSAAEHIFVDTTLFRTGFFDLMEKNRSHPALSPVVEALYNNGRTPAQRLAYFDTLSSLDNRQQLKKFFYRRSFRHHFFIQCEGGSDKHNFYFSTGYDRINPEVRSAIEERKTTLFNFNTKLNGLELSIGFSAAHRKQHNTNGVPEIMRPYEMLTDVSGHPAAIAWQYRHGYVDTAGKKTGLDWKYYPLQEFRLRNNTLTQTDYRYDVALKYNAAPVLPGLEINAFFQQQLADNRLKEIHDKESFFSRNLVNSFTQVRPNEIFKPVPEGHIADVYKTGYNITNFRLQLVYTKKWYGSRLIAMAGQDHIKRKEEYLRDRIYNYIENNWSGADNLNYNQLFPLYYNTSVAIPIPYYRLERSISHNYSSTYINALFRWKEKYDLSASARKERSNLFGTVTNRSFIPLLSCGLAWQLSAERFYRLKWLPVARFSITYGHTGNPPYNALAQRTLDYAGYNTNGDPFAFINSIGMSSLLWEKVRNIHIGFNARTFNDRIELSVNWYGKKARNVVSYIALNPTSGNNTLTGNYAGMASNNLDVVVETKNILRLFRWNTAFQLSVVKDRVTKVEDTLLPAWMYCDPEYITAVKGKPLYGLFSFDFKGLDNAGNPLGNKGIDYVNMVTANGDSDLVYNGRATPGIFGSITNDFSYKQFNLSVTLLYKLNYYFRRQSVNYYKLYLGQSAGSADFRQRWQQPGDEETKTVPSMPVTRRPDLNRDIFYNYSSVLTEKADHLRLQNIQLSYNLEGSVLKKLHLRMANFFLNCSNAGIIWRANKRGIDPDQLTGLRSPVLYTIGFRGTFK
ncbi:TonB-dependent receptor plug domain-containing protein [Niastella populi]|nr:TonB-dependent receptor plug domain-containing protein [Niastella populi]